MNDKKKMVIDAKAMDTLLCGLDAEEFNSIYVCKCRRNGGYFRSHTWMYKSSDESKINILVHKYELFTMNNTKTVSEKYTGFIDIVVSLKSLGMSIPKLSWSTIF